MSFTNAQLATKISDLIAYWSAMNEEYSNWLGGTVDGGPSSDGNYPLTDYTGEEFLIASPAKLADDVSGYVGLASASETAAAASASAASSSETEATAQAVIATAQAVLADSDRVDAEIAQAAAENAAVNAIAQAGLASTSASNASASAAAALVSEDAALVSELAAAASAAAAAASALLVDDTLFAKLADDETITGYYTFPAVAVGDRIFPDNNNAFLTGVGYHVINTGLVISATDSGSVMVRGRHYQNQNSLDSAIQGSWNLSLRLLTGGEPDNPQIEFSGDYFQNGNSSQEVRVAQRDSDGTLSIFFRNSADASNNMTYIVDEIWNNSTATFDNSLMDFETRTDQTGFSMSDSANVEARGLYPGAQVKHQAFNADFAALGIANYNAGGTTNSVSFHMQAKDGFDNSGYAMDQGVVLRAAANATNATQDFVILLPSNEDGDTPVERYRFSDDYFSTSLGMQIKDAAGTDWMQFQHDGTDFNLDATNTTDLNITGITAIKLEKQSATSQMRLDFANELGQTRYLFGLTSTTDDDFFIGLFNDAGGYVGNPLYMDGITGNVIFGFDVSVTGDVTGANLNISNWDTAYGWGDHSVENYAVTTGDTFTGAVLFNGGVTIDSSGTEPLSITRSGSVDLTIGNSGSGDLVLSHSGAGTILIDGIDFSVQAPLWNTAYGWGDHASAGYATLAGDPNFSAGLNITTNSHLDGQADGSLRVQTTYGYIDIGPKNAGWCHIYTDITNGFYFDKPIHIVGNLTLTGTVDGIDIATDVAANTAKVTNATHTGDVTGATALTVDAKFARHVTAGYTSADITVASSAPGSPAQGDIWFDTT